MKWKIEKGNKKNVMEPKQKLYGKKQIREGKENVRKQEKM